MCVSQILDYRDLDKKYKRYFDGAVSIGMVEHVGLSKLDTFFSNIFNSLKPNSYFLLHYVSRTDIFPSSALSFYDISLFLFICLDDRLEKNIEIECVRNEQFYIRVYIPWRMHIAQGLGPSNCGREWL